MKAFWWFEDNAIAGMARPGFNAARWFDFNFQEALLIGWLGQHSSGSTRLNDFQDHVLSYGNKIFKFYKIDEETFERVRENLANREQILETFKSANTKGRMFKEYDVSDSALHFELCDNRLSHEIESLKALGISKIVSLTENHHNKNALEEHFDTIHFSINDLDAPRMDQVQGLADAIREAKVKNEKIAVHCLAGIGRTSTMLIGAHMLLGDSLENMRAHIAKKNPIFVFAGKQAEFLNSLEKAI